MGVASLVNGGSGGSAQKYSLIYDLTCLDYAANLCGATIRHCANAYGSKDAHYVTKETQTTDVTSCPVGATHKA